jgi:hypothetical protein
MRGGRLVVYWLLVSSCARLWRRCDLPYCIDPKISESKLASHRDCVLIDLWKGVYSEAIVVSLCASTNGIERTVGVIYMTERCIPPRFPMRRVQRYSILVSAVDINHTQG